MDLADLIYLFRKSGLGKIGVGHARGQDSVELALSVALQQLVEPQIHSDERLGRHINVMGGINDIDLSHISKVSQTMRSFLHDNQFDLVLGMSIDPRLNDEVKIAVLAAQNPRSKQPPCPFS